jgi:hypothetical protein
MTKAILLGTLLIQAAWLAGCHDEHPETPAAVKHDVQRGADKTGEGIQRAGEAVERAGEKLREKVAPPASPP